RRDFTYRDDVVEAMVRLVDKPAAADPAWWRDDPNPARSAAPWRTYSIGNNAPAALLKVGRLLEENLGREATCELLAMQPGDVPETYADVDDLMRDVGFRPATSIEDGIRRFAYWYREYTGRQA